MIFERLPMFHHKHKGQSLENQEFNNLSIIESLYNSKDKNTLKKLKANRLEHLLLKGLYMMCMDPDNRKKIKSKFVDQLSEIVPEKSINILVLIRYLKEIL